MKYDQYKAMQDIREIEFRDRGSNANTKICFEVQATAHVPAFTQKDFHYVQTRPFTKEHPLRNYNSTLEVHNSSLSTQISIQEVGTKPITKQRMKYTW